MSRGRPDFTMSQSGALAPQHDEKEPRLRPKLATSRGAAAAAERSADSGSTRGLKGERTRRRIMDATARLLKERSFGDIRITEIARAADIVQPNFYTYFPSVDAVVLALADELSLDPLAEFLKREWRGEEGLRLARALAERAIAFWREYGPIMAIVNLLADKQRAEFAEARVRSTRALYKGFEAKVAAAQAEGRLSGSMQPRLVGYECVAVLASAGGRYDLFRASGFSHEELIETHAQMLCRILGAA